MNLDDLEAAASRAFALPRPIQSVSPSDPVPVPSADLTYVHLNGQLKDLPDVTFSPTQYGQRLPGRDPWYATLVADLLSKTVVFVGTTLDEPPLWEHLELRGQKARSGEFRPRSFLVAPHLPLARREMLKNFNIEFVPLDAEQFAVQVLSDLKTRMAEGQDRLSGAQRYHRRGPIIPHVSELRQDHSDINLGQYLLGREPTFRDVSDGFAVQRSFEAEILDDPSVLEARIILITGTAGTGKSTALRRLALHLEADGKNIGWCNPTTIEVGIPPIRDAIIKSGYEYVVVDNVDLFSAQAGPLLRSLAQAAHGAAYHRRRAEHYR